MTITAEAIVAEAELHQLRREQDYVASRKNYDTAGKISKRVAAKEAKLKELTDGKGRVVDFTNAIILATSNLGSDRIQRRLHQRGTAAESPAKLEEDLMEVLRGHFRPEFLNRLHEIIVFQTLTKGEIRQIVLLQLDRVKRSAACQGWI
ncbi:MAG: AAA family ATPase [Anaerolineales bacterium]|nr:AAA family ATPase [Alphaproteobacteria bacterium]MCW5886767.1 AAA family ATPase [Anaerolineales bacterium]